MGCEDEDVDLDVDLDAGVVVVEESVVVVVDVGDGDRNVPDVDFKTCFTHDLRFCWVELKYSVAMAL